MDSFINIAMLTSMIGFLELGAHILFAFAAYYDARSKDNKDAIMWGFLIGFLGLLPGIIYLCIRNSGRGPVFCSQCGINYHPSYPNCPRCGAPNPNYLQYTNPLAEQQAHRAKVFLIVAIVLLLISILVFVGLVAWFFLNMTDFGQSYYYG